MAPLLLAAVLAACVVSTSSWVRGSATTVSQQHLGWSRLRGGFDSSCVSELSPEEVARKREIDAQWNQWGQEWEYCMAEVDADGIGRALHPDPEPYIPADPEDSGGPELLNLDGQHPGPEVWQNPDRIPEHFRAQGWVIDPCTAPAQLVIEQGLRFLDKQWEDSLRERKYGPDISHHNLPRPEQLGPDQMPQLYWDRDGGTRPFINLRDQLPPGWRQLKFAGSTLVLAPDFTFVHNDDPFNTNFNTWGAEVGDRGTWSLNGPSWEQSTELSFHFADMRPGDGPIVMKLHCEQRAEGQVSFYTGEHDLDKQGEIVQHHERCPNLLDGNKCDDSECEACEALVSDEHPSELLQDQHDLPAHCFRPGGLTPDLHTATGFTQMGTEGPLVPACLLDDQDRQVTCKTSTEPAVFGMLRSHQIRLRQENAAAAAAAAARNAGASPAAAAAAASAAVGAVAAAAGGGVFEEGDVVVQNGVPVVTPEAGAAAAESGIADAAAPPPEQIRAAQKLIQGMRARLAETHCPFPAPQMPSIDELDSN